MTEQGVVTQCKNQYASVQIGRNSACASCGKCGMTEKQKHVDFFVENTLGAQVGDVVEVEIPDNAPIAPVAFVAYVLPILPALILMLVSVFCKLPDWVTVLMFFGGLVLGVALIALLEKLRKHKWLQSPTMKQIIRKSTAANLTEEQK